MPTGTPPALRRPESDSRSDLSLARNGRASQRFHSGVKVPGLPLRIPTGFFPARSALRLRNLDRFAPVATASTPQARCRISTNRYRPSRTPPLPFWAFYRPSGSECSTSVQPVNSPSELARFPFAPRCRRLLGLPTADHRSRIATFPAFAVLIDLLTLALSLSALRFQENYNRPLVLSRLHLPDFRNAAFSRNVAVIVETSSLRKCFLLYFVPVQLSDLSLGALLKRRFVFPLPMR
jgi:hypothetical protein